MKLAVLFSLLLVCLLYRHDGARASAPCSSPAVRTAASTPDLFADATATAGSDIRSISDDAAEEALRLLSIAEDDEDEEGVIRKYIEQNRYLLALSCILFLQDRMPETSAPLPPADSQHGLTNARYITQRVLRI